jgi:quercetin dioxygenase-like cupin family protein
VPGSSNVQQPDVAKIIHSLEFPPKKVEMDGVDGATIRELITARDGAPHFAMRMFEVAPGGHTPLHTHPYEHEVFILDGEGELGGGVEARPLRPGDAVFVPADILHQFRNTGQKTLRFLCLIPNQPS